MSDANNELIYEILKKLQRDMTALRTDVRDIKAELNAIRGHHVAFQQDIRTIYVAIEEIKDRLDRVQARLDLATAE